MSAQCDAVEGSRSTDIGRLVVVPAFGLLMVLNGLNLLSNAEHVGTRMSVAAVSSAVLMTAFYALALRAYLRRPAAAATSRHLGVNVVAVLATCSPLVVPLLHPDVASAGVVEVGDGLMLAGLMWSVWALRALGRSLSIIPQARAVVSHGPYRLVRHPLYLGEIVSTAGFCLVRYSPLMAGLWASLVCLQVYRAGHEERVLRNTLPDYHVYAARTRRLVPGLY